MGTGGIGALLPEQGCDAGHSGNERDRQHDADASVICFGTGVRRERVVAVGGGMIEMVRGLGHAVARVQPLEDLDGIPVLVHGRRLAAAH